MHALNFLVTMAENYSTSMSKPPIVTFTGDGPTGPKGSDGLAVGELAGSARAAVGGGAGGVPERVGVSSSVRSMRSPNRLWDPLLALGGRLPGGHLLALRWPRGNREQALQLAGVGGGQSLYDRPHLWRSGPCFGWLLAGALRVVVRLVVTG